MKETFHKFMSAVDIDCFRTLRDSEVGKTLPYADLLQIFIINHKENMTVSELAERLNLSRPATTQKVNELERQGLVIKVPSSKDKRVVYLTLSDKVKQGSQSSRTETVMDKVEESFSKEKIEIFNEIFNFMADYILEVDK